MPEDIAKHIESLLEPFGHKEHTLGYWEREISKNGIDYLFSSKGDAKTWEAWREPKPWRIPPQHAINLHDSWWWYDSGLARAVEMIEGSRSSLDVLPLARKQEILNRK